MGSTHNDIRQIIKKYDIPAANPHKKRLLGAFLENNMPAVKEEIQYITIILISTIFSSIENLYNRIAIMSKHSPVNVYDASKHFNNETILIVEAILFTFSSINNIPLFLLRLLFSFNITDIIYACV